jgi:hypothetical protein
MEETERDPQRRKIDDQATNVPTANKGPLMILFVPSFLATLVKGWAMFSLWPIIVRSPGLVADEVSVLVVMIFLTIYAASGGKR